MSSPRDVDDLRARIRSGWQPGYVLFLEPTSENEVGPGCLSQWYHAPMQLDGERFPTAEHYMMWYKARLFGDTESMRELMRDESPAVAKAMGRRVRNFSTSVWERHRFEVVLRASIAKFEQHPQLLSYLRSTGGRVLAEASPVDLIWGTGAGVDHPHVCAALEWRGLNLLGFALMQARDRLGQSEG